MEDTLRDAIIESVTDAADAAERKAVDDLRRQYRQARFLVVSVGRDRTRRSTLHLTFDRADDSAAFEKLTRSSLVAMLDAVDADEPGITHVLQAGGNLESRGIASDLAVHAGIIRRALVTGVDCAVGKRHQHWPRELGTRYGHLRHAPGLDHAIGQVHASVDEEAPVSRADVISAYHKVAETLLVSHVAGGDPDSPLVQELDRILAQHLAALGEAVAGVITRDAGIVAAVNADRKHKVSGLQPVGDQGTGPTQR